jgi:hypothetical protein
MRFYSNSRFCFALTLLISLGFVSQVTADTLFNRKNPEKIGHGSQNAQTITWKDCDGNNETTYKSPPYSVHSADNCSVGPPTFGLECQGEKCTVVDEHKIQEYLPDARQGDVMTLQIRDKSVVLEHNNARIEIAR